MENRLQRSDRMCPRRRFFGGGSLLSVLALFLLLLLVTREQPGGVDAFSASLDASSKQSKKIPSTTTTSTTKTDNPNDWVADAFTKDVENNGRVSSPNAATHFKSGPVIGPAHALIYDTTLRDGTQGESISASVDDKLKITKRLAAFGVDYVEAGWPGSNPKDADFFDRAKTELSPDERSRLSAFGSTRRKNVAVEDDAQVQALLDSEAPTICIVAKCHAWQVTDILQTTLQENLAMIKDTVEYLVSHGRNVMVDMEHALDGYEHDADYALQCCRAAADAGASCVVLCDTNGGSMPWQVEKTVKSVVDQIVYNKSSDVNDDDDGGNDTRAASTTSIGIHCHNDCNMAVANSIMAISAGAGMVQGTINGIGERTGNADLCSIIPSLALKCETNMSCRDQLNTLTSLSHYVDEILNRTPNSAAPFVGASAFAHKGGLHVAAMKRSSKSYQHVDPSEVGNESRVLISELSGRQNIMGKFEALGLDPVVSSEKATLILQRIKQLEALGYTFEGAEASVHLMMLHASKGYCPQFRVLDYAVNCYDTHIDSESRFLRMTQNQNEDRGASGSGVDHTSMARATVKVRTNRLDLEDVNDSQDMYFVQHQDRLEVGEGNGPVNALANALMRALEPAHPMLKSVELVDYKVRILDTQKATSASVRVMIEFRDNSSDTTWTTVSADTNVISASFNALVDGVEYALIEHAESCMLCDDAY